MKLNSSKMIKSSLLINNKYEKLNSIPLEKSNYNTFQKITKINTTIVTKSTLSRRSTRISQKESFVYIPKVICLVLTHPYNKTFKKIFKSIYQYYSDFDNNKEIPIEKYITNLIIEVPISSRGLYSISYELLENNYIFKGY